MNVLTSVYLGFFLQSENIAYKNPVGPFISAQGHLEWCQHFCTSSKELPFPVSGLLSGPTGMGVHAEVLLLWIMYLSFLKHLFSEAN